MTILDKVIMSREGRRAVHKAHQQSGRQGVVMAQRRGLTLCALVALATSGWSDTARAVTGPTAVASYRIVVDDRGFQPTRIKARVDQDVKIVIVNKGAHVHNFVLPAFYIYTQNLQPGATTSVGFQPDKTGLYPFFSDTGGSPEAGLSGQIDVQSGP